MSRAVLAPGQWRCLRYSVCCWAVTAWDKCSTTCLYPFLCSLNKPGLGALLRSLALILQAVEALEEGCNLIGLVFSESQELIEWLNEVRAWQLVNQLGSQEISQGDRFLMEFCYVLKCMLFCLTVSKTGKKSMNKETEYSTDFWNKIQHQCLE